MQQLGFNTAETSLAYEGGSPAALGNYIANCYIDFGLQDGANEANDYANTTYAPVNPPIEPDLARQSEYRGSRSLAANFAGFIYRASRQRHR